MFCSVLWQASHDAASQPEEIMEDIWRVCSWALSTERSSHSLIQNMARFSYHLAGLLFGFALSTLTLFGDLGESLFKRFGQMKDSGNLLPGHGGAFRPLSISLIWAA